LVVAVSAVVVDGDGRVLLHKRRDNNLWSLLGGVMEPGESIVGAVCREVQEESSLKVAVDRMIGVYSDPEHVIEYSDGEIRQQFSICFACHILSGQPHAGEESCDLRFFSQDEIETMGLHPAQLIRLRDYWSDAVTPFVR
jgi:ADP-ribose pyrophosphatase YjhB (NUDIX family)